MNHLISINSWSELSHQFKALADKFEADFESYNSNYEQLPGNLPSRSIETTYTFHYMGTTYTFRYLDDQKHTQTVINLSLRYLYDKNKHLCKDQSEANIIIWSSLPYENYLVNAPICMIEKLRKTAKKQFSTLGMQVTINNEDVNQAMTINSNNKIASRFKEIANHFDALFEKLAVNKAEDETCGAGFQYDVQIIDEKFKPLITTINIYMNYWFENQQLCKNNSTASVTIWSKSALDGVKNNTPEETITKAIASAINIFKSQGIKLTINQVNF